MTRDDVTPGDGPLIYLIAGEPSGDQLGARLMAALKRQTGGRVRFAGLGGELMAEQGLASLFPTDELAILGIVEVVPHIRRIYRRIRETVAAVQAARPDALVTIDSPSFTLEVSGRLKGQGIPLIHYVAPTVWAWKPWRAKKMAGYLDHLLVLLPFEPPYFEVHGLATTMVGHPAVERTAGPEAAARLRETLGIAPEAPLLCLLPGSRKGEVTRLLPTFGGAVELLAERFGGLRVVLPTVGGVAGLIEQAVKGWTVPVEVVRGSENKFAAFAAADVGLAASGTVTVELAVAGLPSVVAYKVSPLTAMIGRRLLKVEHAAVPSLVLGREVQPEFLQTDCTAATLATALGTLLSDPAARQAQLDKAAAAAKLLGYGEQAPSEKAAAKILEIIGQAR